LTTYFRSAHGTQPAGLAISVQARFGAAHNNEAKLLLRDNKFTFQASLNDRLRVFPLWNFTQFGEE
jgi:hypothetical protein